MSKSTSNCSEPVIDAVTQFLAEHVSNHSSAVQKTPSRKIKRIIVALSGGRDSICLLDALAKTYNIEYISAVYIDHGLQAASQQWSSFNENICKTLGINYNSMSVSVNENEASLEQAARVARYKALESLMDETSCLVTAQHLDDQAETFLLQLFRGAGSKGLSSMPYITNFGKGSHARPLLKVSQAQIEEYVKQHQLTFIDDPSNLDLNIRRNFLRKQVLPLLKNKWSGVNKVLSQSAETQSATQRLLDEVAASDLNKILNPTKNTLLVDKLIGMTDVRQNNVLRFWLDSNQLKMPSLKVLNQIRVQFLQSSIDNNPVIEIQSKQLRRYRNDIYLIDKTEISGVDEMQKPLSKEWNWDVNSDFNSSNGLSISLNKFLQEHSNLQGKPLKVSLREGGETLYFEGNGQGTSLKNYFQEKGVPPWLRDQTLLVWHQGKIIFVQEKIHE